MTKVTSGKSGKKALKKMEKVEAAIGKHCKSKKLSNKEKKVCYYLIDIKRKVSQPLSIGVPASGVCRKLMKESAEICAIRFNVKTAKGQDYSKLRVKELKQVRHRKTRWVVPNSCCPPRCLRGQGLVKR